MRLFSWDFPEGLLGRIAGPLRFRFLFQPLIHDILDNPEGGGGFTQILATSRNLYRSLEQSAAYHRTLLEKCLQRL